MQSYGTVCIYNAKKIKGAAPKKKRKQKKNKKKIKKPVTLAVRVKEVLTNPLSTQSGDLE